MPLFMSATPMSASEQFSLPGAGADIFGEYGAAVTCASAVILMLAISTIDKLTGHELQLFILYLIPVALVTWSAGRTWGLAMAAVAIIAWLVTFHATQPALDNLHFYWDGAVSLATLMVFAVLIDRLHKAMERSNARLFKVLEKLDNAVYVADAQKEAVLYGNRRFRDTLQARPYESLSRLPAEECAIDWPDGRRVVVRMLKDQAR
jgi:K+-sensing histidine kinase KdpD